jgi:hypothetical protein
LLGSLVGIDASQPAQRERGVAELCRQWGHPERTPIRPPDCPYPGMAPFDEAQSDRFYGRDADVRELLARLHVDPFVAVIGPSGSGKSSLVFAGLLPALRASNTFLPGPGGWAVRTLRPGADPVAALAAALGAEGDRPLADPQRVVAALLATEPDTRRLVLVVDQFEEVFTVTRAPDQAAAFVQALLALYAVRGVYLVLTVRADFYAELMATALWPTIQAHRYEVAPLGDDGLRDAIVRPAAAEGVYLDNALVERLVADAGGEPGALPLVQETLLLMWDHLERHYLPLSAYEDVTRGGGDGRTGLQAAIARRAEAAYGGLEPAQQAVARRVFVSLVQFGEGRADTRRQETIGNLRSGTDDGRLLDETLRHLADRRLLVLSGEDRGPDGRAEIKVDIAHEALITGWPRFQEWILADRDAALRRRRMALQVSEWVKHGRDESFLYGGSLLLEARGYARDHPGDLTPDEEAFLAASSARQAARDRARYIGQAAGMAVGAGLGYGVAFGLAYPFTNPGLPPDTASFVFALTVLAMLALGQAVGFSIGLGLWLFRARPTGRTLASGVAGGVVGAVTYNLFVALLSEPGDLSTMASRAFVGAAIGGGLGLGVALAPRRWRLLGPIVGGVVAFLVAFLSGGLGPFWSPGLAVASGLALGLLTGLGLQLASAEGVPARR